MDSYSIIRQAIVDRQQIIASYGGRVREMCPHAIGTKGGTPQALFFQFGGSSSQGLPAGGEWRCLTIADLSAVVARPGPWFTGDNHSQRQTCIDVVDIETYA